MIRPAIPLDIAGIARTHVEAWRTAYWELLPAEFLAQLSYERHVAGHEKHLALPGRRYFVAEDSAQGIVGFASGGPERSGDPVYKGEVYAIYLLEAHRGHGVGSELMKALAQSLAAEKMESMLVWVFSEHWARRFYEKLGGERLRTEKIEVGGVTLEMTAYGWTDLRKITGEKTSG
jgi:L-amino acid N-acyltransferase YncA